MLVKGRSGQYRQTVFKYRVRVSFVLELLLAEHRYCVVIGEALGSDHGAWKADVGTFTRY